MALGTATIVAGPKNQDGFNVYFVDLQPTAGANYQTGGETFTSSSFGGKGDLVAVVVAGSNQLAAGNGPSFSWDPTNSKIKAYGTAASATGLTEIAAAVDLSALRVRLVCYTNKIG